MTDKIQALMNAAYDRYQNGWSKQQFNDQLDAKERIAVFIGNMNYQVGNGGFSQWMYNRYATEETVGLIERKLQEVNSPEAQVVLHLLEIVRRNAVDYGWDLGTMDDDDEFDGDIDTEFYKVNEELMRQVEAKFF